MSKYINPHKMFTGPTVPLWLMERPELSPGSKLCYARLAMFAGKDGECYPSREALAGAMAVSPKQITRYVTELCEHKLIEEKRSGQGNNNSFHFLDHKWSRPETNVSTQEATDVSTLKRTDVSHPTDIKENHIKGRSGKKTKQAEPTPSIPADWPEDLRQAWDTFVQYRRESKNPLTTQSTKLVLGKLAKVSHKEGAESLRAAVERGWTSIFPPSLESSRSRPQGGPGARTPSNNAPPPKAGQVRIW